MGGYHRGELAVQERAGLARRAASAERAIRSDIPEVAAEFLGRQPFLVVGGADRQGRIWATQLTGEPGFLAVPAPDVLTVGALPPPDDPLAGLLSGADGGGAGGAGPARIGMIAIEPATRRRMRMNGRAVRDGRGLRVTLDQAVANCPKYIQERHPHRIAPGEAGGQRRWATDGDALSPAQQEALRVADTFFVATASDRGDADASHRGGNPGFVQVVTPRLLRWPDYAGNGMFLTLGNLELNPAAGLFVPDWGTGSALHLTGFARTVWGADEVARVPGAERLVEFEITAVREVAAASPLRWSAPAFHRFNPPVAS
ncbi:MULTISPECIES: pyridoxamine 5'-phosphate oxidase family protein [Streptomyces]|uniref:pyridoxamine 5'-phosphate oxidase family protein n=1 Tax=Streptomyces TaxID=1883 RepID=UPI000516B936|nr:pyridoxamine 5'-phosphate oxidase family protein [Streptomyces sp. CNS654]